MVAEDVSVPATKMFYKDKIIKAQSETGL